MTSKSCFKCGETKLLTDFYKHSKMADGHLNKCKACTKRDVTLHRGENVERIREYDRTRSKLEHRKEKIRLITAQWRRENPNRRAAQLALGKAVRNGSLQPLPCLECGISKTEAHHPDYERPLDVIWLCTPHHRQTHALFSQLTKAEGGKAY